MIIQFITFRVKPEKRDEFLEVLRADQDGANSEPGFLEFRMFQSASDPNIITIFERIESEEALEFHRAQPYTQAVGEIVKTALVDAPDFQRLEEVS